MLCCCPCVEYLGQYFTVIVCFVDCNVQFCDSHSAPPLTNVAMYANSLNEGNISMAIPSAMIACPMVCPSSVACCLFILKSPLLPVVLVLRLLHSSFC